MADGLNRIFKAVRKLSISHHAADGSNAKRRKLNDASTASHKFRCNECDQGLGSKRALRRHLKQNKRHIGGSATDRPFKCSYEDCNMTFVRKPDRERHEDRIHVRKDDGHSKNDKPTGMHSDEAKAESLEVELQSSSKALVILSKRTSTDIPQQSLDSDIIPKFNELSGSKQQLPSIAEDHDMVQHYKRENQWKDGRPQSIVPCGLCRKPFQHDDLKGLSKHIAEHTIGFEHGYRCDICSISFISQSDLRAHESSARKGDCGFTFEHKVPCTGHHPPAGVNGSEESDRFDFCFRLASWEHSQLRAYWLSIASLRVAAAKLPREWACTISIGEIEPPPRSEGKHRAWGTTDCTHQLPSHLDIDEVLRAQESHEIHKRPAHTKVTELNEGDGFALSSHDLFCRAAFAGDTNTVSTLLSHGYSVDARDSCGYAPLEYAALSGSEAMMSLLLNFGADPRPSPSSSVTALGTAILCGHLGLIRILLSYKAPLDAEDPMLGGRPLHYAIDNGNVDLARILLEAGADPTTWDNRTRLTAIRTASLAEEKGMISLLQEHCAEAVSKYRGEVIAELSPERLSPALTSTDFQDSGNARRSLQPTTHSRETYHHLMDMDVPRGFGRSIPTEDVSGGTVLAAVQSNASPECILRMVAEGASVDEEGTCNSAPYKITPVMSAMMNDNHDLVDVLLDLGARLDICLSTGDTLFSSLMKGQFRIGPEMREKALHNLAKNKEPAQGNFLCAVAKMTDNFKDIETLIEAGCNVNARDEMGRTVLHLAVSNPLLGLAIPALVRAGADVEASDERGRSALIVAASSMGNVSNVETLIKHGADIQSTDSNGRSVLMTAMTKARDPAIVNAVVQAGVDLEQRDEAGATLLHHAVSLESFCSAMEMRDTAKMLIEAGANVNAKDNFGRSVLDWATSGQRNWAAVKLLWDAGAEVNGCDIEALCRSLLGRRGVLL